LTTIVPLKYNLVAVVITHAELAARQPGLEMEEPEP
jgi:hypothetical protein